MLAVALQLGQFLGLLTMLAAELAERTVRGNTTRACGMRTLLRVRHNALHLFRVDTQPKFHARPTVCRSTT